MCDRNETCRPGGTDATPETFWDVYELANNDQADGQGGDQGHDQYELYQFSKEEFCQAMQDRNTNPRS